MGQILPLNPYLHQITLSYMILNSMKNIHQCVVFFINYKSGIINLDIYLETPQLSHFSVNNLQIQTRTTKI